MRMKEQKEVKHVPSMVNRLTKIYKFKNDDPDLFESDVPETTRVLVDTYVDSDIPSEGIVTMTFDI